MGIFPPFLSLSSFLGVPELILNCMSDSVGLFDPTRHYNIIVSCFLLIGTIEGIKKISQHPWIRKIVIEKGVISMLFSCFILSSTLMHSYTWLRSIYSPRDRNYAAEVKQSLSFIPKEAFVTVPTNLAVYVSGREKYSLIEQCEYGDYIIIDTTSFNLNQEVASRYTQLFKKGRIMVVKLVKKIE